MKTRPIIFLLAALLSSPSTEAADFGGGRMAVDFSSFDNNVSTLYGEACEPIKQGEVKSTVRMRATDKASFSAVKSLNSLNEFQKKVSEHDFNVMIYNIVDNYVEDLTVRTTKQNNAEICVEITGYVPKDDIHTAIEDIIDEVEKQKLITSASGLRDDEMQAEPQTTAATPPVAKQQLETVTDPQNMEIKTVVSPAISERSAEQPKIPQGKPLYAPEPQAIVQKQSPQAPEKVTEKYQEDQRELVYIAPTAFFNNTESATHAEILRKLFGKNDYFYLTDKKELADYVVTPKVLRAKVDPINANTNRLQMVVSVGAEFVNSSSSTVEHQNRFILFSSEEDEQQAAAKLMNKLLGIAGETILAKVEAEARSKSSNPNANAMLTPGS